MRKQIKGLDRASTNAQDGVSAVQTAEGALTEVHSMLQRMNELAVQSANGTNSATDRKAIQDEVNQLSTEIDRVSETTKFNETYLLKGDSKTAAKANFMKSGYTLPASLASEGSNTKDIDSVDKLKAALAAGTKIYTEVSANAGDKQDASKIAVNGKDYAYVTKLYDANGKQVSADNIMNSKNADGTTATNYYTTDGGAAAAAAKNNIIITAENAKDATKGFIQQFDVNGNLSFNLHVGADSSSDNKIKVELHQWIQRV